MRDTCPVCEKPAKCGLTTGDRALIPCEDCGTYEISGTALEVLKNERLEKKDLDLDSKKFKALVEKKRGDSEKDPWITEADIKSILP